MKNREFCRLCMEELEGMLYGETPVSDEEVIKHLTGLVETDTMAQLFARAIADKRKIQTVG